MPDFEIEQKLWEKGHKIIAGADEVGRGAFAGSVVAAATVFAANSKLETLNSKLRIDDSKKLTKLQREKADNWIKENCLAWGVGEASVSIINKLGITKATNIAFRRAVKMLNAKCQVIYGGEIDYLLIDAFYLPYTRGLRHKNQLAVVKGDNKSLSIAAASIIAKVYRDGLMEKLASKQVLYKWDINKGYGTKTHRDAIQKYGVTKLHRKNFVKKLLINLISS